jgi:hypothetical protein
VEQKANQVNNPVEKDWHRDTPIADQVSDQPISKLVDRSNESPYGDQGNIEWEPDSQSDVGDDHHETAESEYTDISSGSQLRWIRFVVTLTIFNIIPAIGFGYGTVHYWNMNLGAAIVCVSGLICALLLGGLYILKQVRSAMNAMEYNHLSKTD